MGWGGPLTTWHLAHTNPSPCLHRFPFYYEIKMAFVLWLLSPYTKGASLLYRKFVHPSLSRHEKVPLGVDRAETEEGLSGKCVREKGLHVRFREPEVPGSYFLFLCSFTEGL